MTDHNIKSDQVGNLEFEGIAEYRSSARNATEETVIRIIRNGYDDGAIILSEVGDFSVNDYHLDFTPKYQKYVYSNDDNKLVIHGNSPKMGGRYSVSISPI